MPQPRSPVLPLVLEDKEAIRVLLDSRQRRALLPFVGRETTIAAAARQLGDLPNTMLARVKRWERLGLVNALRKDTHLRGQQTTYRCPTDALFVPHAATVAEDLQALALELYGSDFQGLMQAYTKAGQGISDDWGIRFERQGEAWSVRPLRAPDYDCDPLDEAAPAALLTFSNLLLDFTAAKALQRDLQALLERHAGLPSSPQARLYQVFLGLA